MFGESVSPLGSSGCLHGELSLHPGPQLDGVEWVKPPLGCSTGQDGVTGTNGCGSVHTWSHRSVPRVPPRMLSSHRTLSPCQKPNSDLVWAALSPGTLVPRCYEQPEQTGAVCRAAAGMLAPSPARCRAGSSHPLPAASLLPQVPWPWGKEKGFMEAGGQRGEDLSVQTSQLLCLISTDKPALEVRWLPDEMYLPTLTGVWQ